MSTPAKEVEVAIAKNPKLRVVKLRSSKTMFETRRRPYIMIVPIYWLIVALVVVKKSLHRRWGSPGPEINFLLFDGLGLMNRAIKEGAKSWRALDIIYNYSFGGKRTIGGRVDDFWIGMINAQAVRNRLKVVKQELRKAILAHADKEEVRLLSLACGSAQGVIEVIAELKAEGIRTRVLLLDSDLTALDYAEKLAFRHGVFDQVETVCGNVLRSAGISRKFQPDVVEMLGMLDYLSSETAIKLIGNIRRSLKVNGVFLTCNIAPNAEMHFLRHVINWDDMIYRSSGELAEIIEGAGFTDYVILYEPHGIHGVVVAQI